MTKKNLSIEESLAFKEHRMLDCFKIIIENANGTVLFKCSSCKTYISEEFHDNHILFLRIVLFRKMSHKMNTLILQ
jgi:hypothetical protein